MLLKEFDCSQCHSHVCRKCSVAEVTSAALNISSERICGKCLQMCHEKLLIRSRDKSDDSDAICLELDELDKLLGLNCEHARKSVSAKKANFSARRSLSTKRLSLLGGCARCAQSFGKSALKSRIHCKRCRLFVCGSCSVELPEEGMFCRQPCADEHNLELKSCVSCRSEFDSGKCVRKAVCSECERSACAGCIFLYKVTSLGENDPRYICNLCVVDVKQKILQVKKH